MPGAEDVSWKTGEGSSRLALCVTPSEKPPFPPQSELEVLPTCFLSTCVSPYQPHPLESNFAGRAGASPAHSPIPEALSIWYARGVQWMFAGRI